MSKEQIIEIPAFVKLTKEQIRELFNNYTNGGNYIKIAGLRNCLFNYFNVTQESENFDDIVKYTEILYNLADGNGFFNAHDGRLNFNEFSKIITLLPKKYSSPKKSLARMIYLMMDVDKKGYISSRDYLDFMQKSQLRVTKENLKDEIEIMDRNDDHYISYNEFMEIYGV